MPIAPLHAFKRLRITDDTRPSAVNSLIAQPSSRLSGTCRVPGDKSISHRALMVASLTVGESHVRGLLEGDDVMRTAAALRMMGAQITQLDDRSWTILGCGVGGLHEAEDVLDLGNAGTGVRLLMGVVTGQPGVIHFTGDASLRQRPMGRVATPLRAMGAKIIARDGERLPLTVVGSDDVVPIEYATPVASAQIKSAVMLAGLSAPGETTVVEQRPTRDHTERLLRRFGAEVRSETSDDGHSVVLVGQPELIPADITVPGDPSSAAFVVVAALITKDSEVTINGVGINPRRVALFQCLREMGADLTIKQTTSDDEGEPIADIVARSSNLSGIDVPAERAPDMIDEYPILAVAAACASGTTHFHGVGELRLKESDRIAAMAQGLAACGAEIEEHADGLTVHGRASLAGGARIAAAHDHRIAMAFLVAGCAASEAVRVDGISTIDTSFPGFAGLMRELGAKFKSTAA